MPAQSRKAAIAILLRLAISINDISFSVDALAIPGPQRKILTKHNHDTFETFVTMRTGIDMSNDAINSDETEGNDWDTNGSESIETKLAFWTGQGQLYSSPSGEVLANIDGFDVAKAVRISDDVVRQFSRKIFWFRDPITNEVITDYKGHPVRPIKYDWQVFDYKRGMAKPLHVPMPSTPSSSSSSSEALRNDYDQGLAPINPTIVKSVGSRTVPCMPITPRYAGPDTLLYQMPLFIDIQTNKVSYQAWEVYDYTVDLSDGVNGNGNRPPTVSWSRQGSTMPFCQNGDGVMHFAGHKVDRFEDLPRHLIEMIEQNDEYEMFKKPPSDMEEVLELEAEFVAMVKARKAAAALQEIDTKVHKD